MWVRSQDRTELIDISNKRLFISKDMYNKFNIYIDLMVDGDDSSISLGSYGTSERAKAVLNKIEAWIEDEPGKVFNMPSTE